MPPVGHIRNQGACTVRQLRDADAQHPARTGGSLSQSEVHPRHRRRAHDPASGFRLPHLPPAGSLPRRSLQARAADGGEPLRSRTGQRRRLAQRGGQVYRIRRREDGHDLDGQGRQPDQHHGLYETSGRDLRAVARPGRRGRQGEGQDEVRHHTLRQCAGFERFGDPALPRADCQGRPGYGDTPRYHALLHDDSGGLSSGDGGRHHVDGHPDLCLRHGAVGKDRPPGQAYDRTGRSGGRQGHQDRIHGIAPGRETLRRGAVEYGEHASDVARPHPHCQSPRVRLYRCPQGRTGVGEALTGRRHSGHGSPDEEGCPRVQIQELAVRDL